MFLQDDVWLQGLTINHAKDVAINVDKGKQNSKLIDMTFIGNYVPDTDPDNRVSAGVVSTELDSSLEVLRSIFKWNKATPIYSRGSLVVYDSYFYGNSRSKVRKWSFGIYHLQIGSIFLIASIESM